MVVALWLIPFVDKRMDERYILCDASLACNTIINKYQPIASMHCAHSLLISARCNIYTSRAYAIMPVRLSVCL